MSGTWQLWMRQILAILRLELRTSFSPRRSVAVYILASMMPIIFIGHALHEGSHCSGSHDQMAFAGVFQLMVLRLALFFGCVVIFLNLFRGEVHQKSLHYWLLAPVRREVLVIGKYLAGAVTTVTIFTVSVVFSYWVMLRHLGTTESHALAANAAWHLPVYAGVTVLACLGYGAVFLLLGMMFRNPIIPAVVVLLWESFIVFFPALLKKISVIFYLESLCPIRVPFNGVGQMFAIPAAPTPAWIALPALLLLTAAIVALASVRIRKTEINYGAE